MNPDSDVSPVEAAHADRLHDLVADALDLPSGERVAFLTRACGDDAALLAEACALMEYDQSANTFLGRPAYMQVAGEHLGGIEAGSLAPGTMLGENRLLSLLGEGGMGEVYLAEDTKLERRVAVKLLKRRLDDASLARRFRHERKVLAALTHPNIARLYGGGVTPEGRSYLVMEYIEGERLDKFCEARKLGVTERLALFRKVCAAVSYAHQNLVVHRDLKPANIRVTPEGEPKLLDFGIAKLLDPEGDAARPPLDPTATLQGAMTPEYASPEQLRGETITTSSDVYSLGVVLYELLCGQRPFAHLKGRRPDELARAVCEEEPPRPSTVAGRKATTTTTTTTLTTATAATSRQLAGDLDNVVAKALSKEPARRYPSVLALSEDLRRHGEGLPVTARKDTLGYRTGKFVRRNKFGVTAAVIVTLALVFGLMATAWQAHVADQERDHARQERDRAKVSQQQTERLNHFLGTLLTSADPGHMGKDVKFVQVLDAAGQALDKELADEPALRAQAHQSLGDTYEHLALGKQAEEHHRAALAILHGLHGPDDPIIAQAEFKLAVALTKQNRFADTVPLLRHVVLVQRRQSPPDVLALGQSLGFLGSCLSFMHRSAEARINLDEALQVLRASGNETTKAYATTVATSGLLALTEGNLEQAADQLQQAVELTRKLAPTSANFVIMENNLALVLYRLNRLSEMEALLQQEEEDCKKNVGQNSPPYAAYLIVSASLDWSRGDYPVVVRKTREAMAILTAANYPPHEDYLASGRIFCGVALTRSGHPEEAEPLLALQTGEDNLDNSALNLDYGNRKTALGECRFALKRYAEAEPLLLDGYADLEKRLGPKKAITMAARQRLHDLYTAWNKPEQAARYTPGGASAPPTVQPADAP